MNTVKIVELVLGVFGILLLFLYFRKPGMKLGIARIARLFAAAVFLYSGFVKGVDPMGTVYKIEDYFYAFGTEWALPYALFLAIFLCAFEFVIGFLLLLNVRSKITSWLLLLCMIAFTFMTLSDALYNTVADCGCFGEALVITNWETFYKNVVIMLYATIIMAHRKKFVPIFSHIGEAIVFVIVAVGFVWFEIFNINHLPLVDFRPWKVGNKMYVDNPKPIDCFLTYRNKETGETKEFLSPNYPYNDSVWMSKWEFIVQRVVDPNISVNFMMEDEGGNNVTDNFIKNPDYQFLVFAYDLDEAPAKSFVKLNELFDAATQDDKSCVMATSNITFDQIRVKIKELQISEFMEIYLSDDIELKTAIRSNPGLILLKDGIVLAKWHYHDIPDYAKIKEKYMN
ncbi:MAG: DoxX family protein [Bacteroidetes bacterium]|nr:DoxX family protein [Bacteroidota bacterium]MBU1720256.1 DoxX family protein [Bacteroidota bacterium]